MVKVVRDAVICYRLYSFGHCTSFRQRLHLTLSLSQHNWGGTSSKAEDSRSGLSIFSLFLKMFKSIWVWGSPQFRQCPKEKVFSSNLPYNSSSKNESNRIMQLKLSLSKQRAPVLGQGTAGAVYWQEVSGVSTLVRLLAAGGSDSEAFQKTAFHSKLSVNGGNNVNSTTGGRQSARELFRQIS